MKVYCKGVVRGARNEDSASTIIGRLADLMEVASIPVGIRRAFASYWKANFYGAGMNQWGKADGLPNPLTIEGRVFDEFITLFRTTNHYLKDSRDVSMIPAFDSADGQWLIGWYHHGGPKPEWMAPNPYGDKTKGNSGSTLLEDTASSWLIVGI